MFRLDGEKVREQRRQRVVQQRPVFLLAGQFARAHGLPQKKQPLIPKNLSALEELNFTKIAIRYSSSLTKDVVFAAIRATFISWIRQRNGYLLQAFRS